jgi:hypothetical protein
MRFLLRYPLRLLGGLADRLVAVAGAVGLSQFPGFVRHYLQRLGGHAAEAAKSVADWQEIADSVTCGSLPDLVAQYRTSALPEVVHAGNKCAADLARLTELEASFDALSNASAWGRGWVFLQRFDTEVFGATVRSFVPNVPLDVESLCYAGVGLVLAIMLFAAVRSLTARTARKTVALVKGRLRRPQAPPPAAIEE